MGGPMASFASGIRRSTAWAMTWAVLWRSTSSPSGVSAVNSSSVHVPLQRTGQVHQPAVDPGDDGLPRDASAQIPRRYRPASCPPG